MPYEYDVIRGDSISQIPNVGEDNIEVNFKDAVEVYLNDGWELAGGIAVDDLRGWHQAVIRWVEPS